MWKVTQLIVKLVIEILSLALEVEGHCFCIEIRHHFLRGHISNGTCDIKFIGIDLQLADLFTKPLSKDRFNFQLNELGIINVNCASQ